MSRIVFDSLKELEKWISGFIRSPGRYVAYRTQNDEFILKPTINPRDNDYIYFKTHSEDESKELTDYLKSRTIQIFNVKDYEWRIDQQIGVKTLSIEES